MEEKEHMDPMSEEREKVQEKIISRRSFIGASGKVIALGMLMHFTMIGNANSNAPSAESRNGCVRVDLPDCNYQCVLDIEPCPKDTSSCPTPYCYNSPADAPCMPALDALCPLLDFCINQDSSGQE